MYEVRYLRQHDGLQLNSQQLFGFEAKLSIQTVEMSILARVTCPLDD